MTTYETRPCNQCNKNLIPMHSSTFHKVCKPCWRKNFEKISSDTNDCVACRDCGMANVPRKHAKLRPVCVQCYKTKMRAANADLAGVVEAIRPPGL